MAATKPQVPSTVASSNDRTVQITAIYRPHRPGIRPDGIGRSGSLMASTWRSYQSLTAWLVPHTIGPANSTPAAISGQRCPGETPDETMPQPSAHIGGNQVIGFNNSSTTRGDGRWT